MQEQEYLVALQKWITKAHRSDENNTSAFAVYNILKGICDIGKITVPLHV